jgi:rare lipoprotein A
MKKYIKIVLFTSFIFVTSPVTFCEFYDHRRERLSIYTKSSFISVRTLDVKSVVKEEVKVEVKVIEDESVTPHIATWYNLHGNRTASGERFHKDSLTAAYNFVKLGTYLKVTNISNEESVIVKVTDRMGNKTANRIDLSISAFDSIANLSSGKVKVIIEVIK